MYTIINDKKYNIITFSKVKDKTLGLMFLKKKINNIYMFPRCSMIHTFFMKQDIDVCMLDKDFNVVYKESNVKKNRVIIKSAYYTLEMPLNTAKYIKDKIHIYDK